MTGRRPGEWPAGLRPVPAPADSAPVALTDASPPAAREVLVPEVRLVAVVDLTGRYDNQDDVSRALYEQTIRASDCHTAIVRLGDDAIRRHLGLARAIAGAFFLSAQRIEVHVPSGTRHAHFAQQVRRELSQICADHERTMTTLRNPG